MCFVCDILLFSMCFCALDWKFWLSDSYLKMKKISKGLNTCTFNSKSVLVQSVP